MSALIQGMDYEEAAAVCRYANEKYPGLGSFDISYVKEMYEQVGFKPGYSLYLSPVSDADLRDIVARLEGFIDGYRIKL